MRKLLLNIFSLSAMELCAQTPALKPARTSATASKPVTNPATTCVIAEGVEQGPVLVYSATGKSYANLSVTWLDEQSVRIDVLSLPEGLYILKFKDGSAKFMKQMNY